MEVGGKQRNYCCSVAKLYPICDSANCGIPGFPVPHRLCELAQIHVHWVGNSTHPSHPLLLLLSFFFPSIKVFPTEAALGSGGQSIGASAAVLQMNIHGWFPLGLTGLSSLLSKGLSKVSSSTTIQKHPFLSIQASLGSNSHSQTRPLENHSFDYGR